MPFTIADYIVTFAGISNPNLANMQMYGNVRMAIGVALFFAMFIHYICFGMAFVFKREKVPRFLYLAKRLWLYNILGALSIGLVQGGVYTAILSW
jgi:hypothetical protein